MAEIGWVLGIESTAHTFSFGLVAPDGSPRPSSSDTIRPDKGGIHPREAADHHVEFSAELLQSILDSENLLPSDISAIAYSQGPGMGPCLRTGASAARALATHLNCKLIGVNHCVAHIEIGREQCGCDDPILLYVSGGNTQVIARLNGRYRVLGETLDIGIGNMLDKFARAHGFPFPGGPVVEKMAAEWLKNNPDASLKGLELPYAVHGMDLAFSGILSAANRLVSEGKPLEAVCWSLQEHAFAACIEVAERALAHTGKSEILLGGGVACNQRINDMSNIMCEQRGASSHCPPKMYCIDNGTMIARLGWLEILSGRTTKLSQSAVDQELRTDQTPIIWA
ncbi:MAG: tRNA N6-adenosine threonylcarbamoyltransferase [Methanobacteriota archaeon]|jgi:universal protein Kae1|nr:MAG: tRNA N6-adenosine threonylcarbamoyltransferase [Euryarchaeota archaeon]|tara:strand:- start:441 stop:1457 length:1017 start_codon:yes stop_codon:yes gene_type:complete